MTSLAKQFIQGDQLLGSLSVSRDKNKLAKVSRIIIVLAAPRYKMDDGRAYETIIFFYRQQNEGIQVPVHLQRRPI